MSTARPMSAMWPLLPLQNDSWLSDTNAPRVLFSHLRAPFFHPHTIALSVKLPTWSVVSYGSLVFRSVNLSLTHAAPTPQTPQKSSKPSGIKKTRAPSSASPSSPSKSKSKAPASTKVSERSILQRAAVPVLTSSLH